MKETLYNYFCYRCKYETETEDGEHCSCCLDQPAQCDTYVPVNFNSKKVKGLPSSLYVLSSYMFRANFTVGTDINFAKEYYKEHGYIPEGACSSVRLGNFWGRNLDWTYDNTAEFIVTNGDAPIRYWGVSGGIPALTLQNVTVNHRHSLTRLIPFQLYDGMNDCGVIANMNVVPGNDVNGCIPSVPAIEKRDEICGVMLVSYILMNFRTAKEAVEYVRDYISVYFLGSLVESSGYALHYMIGDINETYCLEFINGQAVIKDITDKPAMTNFYLKNVLFNGDGSVFTPFTQNEEEDAIKSNNITPNGSGLERYNLINNALRFLIPSESNMRFLMEQLAYTNAYTNYVTSLSDGWWCTEFVGLNGLTCASEIYEFLHTMDAAYNRYENRTRKTADTWHTVHTSIYDIENKTLTIIPQEKYNDPDVIVRLTDGVIDE